MEGKQDPGRLTEMAPRRLRQRIPELPVALEGCVRDYQRFLPKQLLDHLMLLEQKIAEVEQQIKKCMGPFEMAVTLSREVSFEPAC